MSGDEHVVRLHRSSDEERRERDDGQAETADEVLVRECLKHVNILQPSFILLWRAWVLSHWSSSL